MGVFWDENLGKLKLKNPLLYEKVVTHRPSDIGEIIQTQTLPTLRLGGPGGDFAYDPKDPISALKHQNRLPILSHKKSLTKTICVFTGMGLGYAGLIVSEARPDLFRTVILEPCMDLFILAMKFVDLGPLLASDRVCILAGDIDWDAFDAVINDKKIETDFIFCDHPALFKWRPELYAGVKHRAEAYASRCVSSMGVLTRYGDVLFKNRVSNLSLFRGSSSLDNLAGVFQGKPAILIAAGPSLGKSMDQLKGVVGKAVVIAVDSALVPLMNHGIVPDLVTSLDFRFLNSEKLSPDRLPTQAFSLVSNIFAASLAVKRLNPSHLFFSFQENDTQGWLMDELKVEHKMPPVNSVALLSLSLAQMIQADPIILVGYDFAMTSKRTDHVKGAVFSGNMHKRDEYIQVPGLDGKPVNTLPFFLEFKQNFEELIRQSPADYINAGPDGAHIEGTQVKGLDQAAGQYLTQNIPVRAMIDQCVRSHTSSDVASLVKAARSQLTLADKALHHVTAIITQNQKIKVFAQKNIKNGKIIPKAQVPKFVLSALEKRRKLRSGLLPFMPMEEIATRYLEKARQIQKTMEAGSYLAQLYKDSRVVSHEMEGHRKGIAKFRQMVGNLVSYLEKENRFLTRFDQDKLREKDYLGLAELYLSEGNLARADGVLEECTTRFGCSSRSAMLTGECKAGLLDFEAAFRAWADAVQHAPGLEKKIEKKKKEIAGSWIQMGIEERNILEPYLRRAFTICNDKAFYLLHSENAWRASQKRIRGFIIKKMFNRAQALLSIWDPVKHALPEWYFLRARCFWEQGEKNKALMAMEKACEQNQDNVQWMAFHARLLMETGRVDTGIAQLDAAVGLDPEQAVIWEKIGDTLLDAGDFSGASIAYEKCFTALPNRTTSLKKFGDCYFNAGQTAQAEAVYRLVLKRDGQNSGALSAMAKIRASTVPK